VSGGRGGDVYHVTVRDNDSSDMRPGTLRFGLSNLTGPRTIVFDISGVFDLGRTAVAGWDDNGNGWDTASRLNIPANVTIAGQTAPGPVVIAGGLIKAGGTNLILRNVTVAPGYGSRNFSEPERVPAAGDFPDSYVYDAIDISGKDLIIDHVTTIYATDETISMNESVDNATLQFNIISQGQNYPQADAEASGVRYTGHALGSLLQAGSNARISVHHNLYAHQKGRLPRVGTEADALTVAGVGAFNDFRNNVFYNWLGTAGTGASGQASQNNFVANFYLSGPGGDDPSGGASTAIGTSAGGTRIFDGSDALNTKVHHEGNLKDLNSDGDALDGVALVDADFGASRIEPAAFVAARYDGVTDAADAAFTRVLEHAGSRWWERGAIEQRLVQETRSGTGKIRAWADDPFDASSTEGVEWRALVSTPSVARPAGFDTDQDGMPDAWETEQGFDPAVADNNGDADADGYTNLEEYLNELAAWPAPTPALFEGGTNARYAQIENWRLLELAASDAVGARHWQPNRFDSARIANARAMVDAGRQSAGTLEVSGEHAAAVLDVSGGALVVANTLHVGSHAASLACGRAPGLGQVNQSAGNVFAPSIVLADAEGARADYHLTGGVLSTERLAAASSGARFDFAGGTLRAERVELDLVNRGGVLRPGSGRSREPSAIGQLSVEGDLALHGGKLRIDISGLSSSTVDVSGAVELGGELELVATSGAPKAGSEWTILVAGGPIRGYFSRLPGGYNVRVVGQRVILSFGSGKHAALTRSRRPRG
jgi:pectate lyase